MEHFRRHNFLWKLVWPLAWLLLRLKFNYHPVIHPVTGPALIVSNHCTNWDALLLAVTIKNHAYFVASEHIFRNPLLSKLLLWAQAPIARLKGTTASDTALTAIRRMKKGRSVAVFAEGNRTFNGLTADIVESTAKLARVAGATLVTHRFRGGYFSNPRWATSRIRRGRLTGEVVNVYSPEQLKAMTPGQIADAIRADIYEDAYATQAQWHIPYRGKNLAEHLERALYLCPCCGRMNTLHSEGDALSCTACGMTAVYTPYGTLDSGGKLPFSTITEWDRWEAAELKKRADAAGEDSIASDEEAELVEILEDHSEVLVAKGRLAIFRDRLECAKTRIPFGKITGMNVNGAQLLTLTAEGRHFTVRSGRICNMRKYLTAYHAVTAPDKILAI